MAIVSRTNLIKNPSFELDLQLWSAFGGASTSRVIGLVSWRMRVTFPTAAAGVAGASTTVTGLTAGTSYQLWMQVPNANGSTTVQMEAQGITTGAAFATNDTLFKQGSVTFTATGTSATIRLKSAVGSTAGHYVDVEIAICEATQPIAMDYAAFDGSMPGAYWDGPVALSPSVFRYYDTDVAASPMTIVEFDARPVTATDFVLDRNALDDTNVALIDSPRWLHVPDAETVSISRGRQSDATDVGVGSATIKFRDYDGTFDPDNPATPLQINGVPVMRAGMRVRVTALAYSLGALFAMPQFTGSLEDVQIDRTYDPWVTISAVDDIAKLNSSDIPPYDPPIGEGESTLWRALWALGFAGFGYIGTALGPNMQRLMLATGGGGNAGSELRKVANCEGGRLYAAVDGIIHIGTHADDFVTSPAANFTDSPSDVADIEYDSIGTSTSIRTLINRCIVDRGELADAVTAQDDDSVALNQRVWSETIEAPLVNDSDASALAQWRATRVSRSATRVESLEFTVTGLGTFALFNALALDIARVIRVKRYALGRGIDQLCVIEGIDHEITVGSWKITVYTSTPDITSLFPDQGSPFILNTSALDSTDLLASF